MQPGEVLGSIPCMAKWRDTTVPSTGLTTKRQSLLWARPAADDPEPNQARAGCSGASRFPRNSRAEQGPLQPLRCIPCPLVQLQLTKPSLGPWMQTENPQNAGVLSLCSCRYSG